MPRKDSQGDVLRCSFCGKSQEEVKRLIAGPAAYICDECIDLCNDIFREAPQSKVRVQALLLPRGANQSSMTISWPTKAKGPRGRRV